MDEELVQRNGGIYPTDTEYKHTILAPKIITDILSKKDIIFFTGTDYFTLGDLKLARNLGFKIILLSLSLTELSKRNKKRIRAESYEDMSRWFSGMLRYLKKVEDEHLTDKIIRADLPIEEISEELLKGR